MGGTYLAKARIAEIKKRIAHAEQKKKEFSDYISRLKQKYHKGEISYSTFLEHFYQKRNGLSIKEWLAHFDDFINDCKKEIRKERIKLLGNYSLFAFLSLAIISIIVLPFFYFKPAFTGFAVEESQNLSANDSYSEETSGGVQNASPSHPTGQEPLPPSENISAEENISVTNETEAKAIPELNIIENETEIEENITEIPEEIINEAEINQTISNITEQNITKDLILENASVNTTRLTPKIRLGESVKWKKTISSDELGNATIILPGDSENITIKKIKDSGKEDITSSSSITGAVIGGSRENFIFRFLKNILGRITGKVVDESQNGKEIEVEIEIDEIQAEYEVEYETPAPYSVETEKKNGKQVKIFGPDSVHYENVLAFANLDESLKIKNPSSVKIKWIEQNIYINPESVQDTDENGIYDYVEWFVPSLSEQTFEIIVITKAEHLDSNKNFISDIYEEVKELDGIWSEEIQDNEFVRVTFEKNLTNKNDITIYPRIVSGSPKVEVYEKDGNEIVAEFTNIQENQYNKIYLTNLISESRDVFDLKILGGSVEFEHIVDPVQELFEDCADLSDWTIGGGATNNWVVGGGAQAGQCDASNTDAPSNMTSANFSLVGKDWANLTFTYTTSGFDAGEYLRAWVSNGTGRFYLIMDKTATNEGPLTVSFNITKNITHTSTVSVRFTCNVNAANEHCQVDDINVTSYAPDNTLPAISILFPTNLTNTTNTALNVNATYSDASGISEVWYNNDTNLALNKSLGKTPTFFNITNITWSEGIHNVTIYVNDTLGNENWTSVTFMIDSVLPAVEIQVPSTNNTNTSNTNQNINFTFSDLNGITNIWYANDTYSEANKSLGEGGTFYNITNITWSQGKHNVTIYVNDSFGNVNFTTISFTVDSTPPDLTILVPSVNQTNTTNTIQNINFTFSDSSGIAEAWYNNDTTSVANKSLGKDGTFYNITNITWSEGKHNVTIYVNDSAGNLNYTSFSFTVDTIIPEISIAFPTVNNSNGTNTLNVNFTASDSGSGLFNFWYANDTYSEANKSLGVLGTQFNITNITWSDALHNVTIWANDSAGNYNFATISFRIDSVNPSLTILIPEVNQTNTTNIAQNINFTFFDLTGIDSIWYNNDTTSVDNKSLGIGGNYFNITNLTWSEGKHNVTIYVNDSAGNLNFTSISFTIDLTQPDINITYPFNNSVVSDVNADVNYTRSDSVGLFNCWYSNDTYLVNTTLSSCENITTITWEAGAHNVTVWVNDSAGNYNRTTINFSILANTPPEIRNVYNDTAEIIAIASGLNSGPLNTSVIINFSVYDAQGVGNMNNATATINFSKTGEALRQNSTCTQFEVGTNIANYTCNVTMSWYDGAGTWAIQAFISDLDSNDAKNNSANFSVGETLGFELGSLTFPSLAPGMKNQTASVALRLNNTGNKNMAANTTQINATNLRGEVTPTTWIFADNVSVSWNATAPAACDWSNGTEAFQEGANKMLNTSFINVTRANLTKGNYFVNDGNTGQEDFYFCIRTVGSELTSQAYSTLAYGPWQIRILLAFVAIPRKRKKKTEKDKLIEALDLSEYLQIADKLKEEFHLPKEDIIRTVIEKAGDKYGIDRKELLRIIKAREGISIPVTIFSKEIGALESLSKYMKENLGMNYREIARELGRNERTIWTSYKNAVEKQKEIIEETETDINLPLSIFKNNNLTTLEAIIIYLKENGMKYSEIGELLNRDQRNIWTVYSRAKNKKNN